VEHIGKLFDLRLVLALHRERNSFIILLGLINGLLVLFHPR
jgi:hypothetical protein